MVELWNKLDGGAVWLGCSVDSLGFGEALSRTGGGHRVEACSGAGSACVRAGVRLGRPRLRIGPCPIGRGWRGFKSRKRGSASRGSAGARWSSLDARRSDFGLLFGLGLSPNRCGGARWVLDGGAAETRRKGSANSMRSLVELCGCSAELRRKRGERVAARSAEEAGERLDAERGIVEDGDAGRSRRRSAELRQRRGEGGRSARRWSASARRAQGARARGDIEEAARATSSRAGARRRRSASPA
ncbi:hypothetical protein ACMD2_25965, partial [Ananas comosus]